MPQAPTTAAPLKLAAWLSARRRPLVMGIVNVTPDSFHAASRAESPVAAAERALAMEAEGADLLDLGAESTRPGSEGVTAGEELKRLLPVLERLAGRVRVPISIDTRKAAVARECFARGASVLNDVSALRDDKELAPLAARLGCPVILMHMQGSPRTMQSAPRYGDVVGALRDFFSERLAAFVAAGGDLSQVLLDPGIGFGKDLEHNLELLRRLTELRTPHPHPLPLGEGTHEGTPSPGEGGDGGSMGMLPHGPGRRGGRLGRMRVGERGPLAGFPIVVGASRKSFLGRLLAGPQGATLPPEKLPPTSERLEASLAAALFAAERGADILRVHDVQATVRALETWRGLGGAA